MQTWHHVLRKCRSAVNNINELRVQGPVYCSSRVWRWIGRVSDRVVRPLKPGNAGGGKDPDFWRAFEEGEVKGIGKSLQTPTSRALPWFESYARPRVDHQHVPAKCGLTRKL